MIFFNANIDKQDPAGNTTLHYATQHYSHAKAAFLLLQYGARSDIKNKQNVVPIINTQTTYYLKAWHGTLMTLLEEE